MFLIFLTIGFIVFNSTNALFVSEFSKLYKSSLQWSQSQVSYILRNPYLCIENGAETLSCYSHYFEQMVFFGNPETAFADMKARYGKSAFVKEQCHQIAHAIGHAAAEKYKSVGGAFTHGDSFCWSGYYHGVMEELVGDIKPDDPKLSEKLNSFCADLKQSKPYSFDHYNCAHGVGHGVMSIVGDDLFHALALCDNVADSWERTSCYSGVFMENVIVSIGDADAVYFKNNDPLYPCTVVGKQYQESCLQMQTSRMLEVAGGDFTKVFSGCRTLADEVDRATCFQGIGRDASGQSVSNLDETKRICLLGSTIEEQTNCAIGAVKDFISYYHSDIEAKDFCTSMPENVRGTCSQTASSYYESF